MKQESDFKGHELPRVHIARPGSLAYAGGRQLAADVYRSVWKTRSLTDDHALGVVAYAGERVVGNVNLQLASSSNELPSERYFEPDHWRTRFCVAREELGEVAALAIHAELDFEARELTLLGLMYGLCIGSRMLGLRVLSTVEHRPLARRMKGYLGLPLQENEQVIEPSQQVPDDGYWRGEEKPRIYYLDLLDPGLLRTVGIMHAYLVSKGIPLHLGWGSELPMTSFVGFAGRLKHGPPSAANEARQVDAA